MKPINILWVGVEKNETIGNRERVQHAVCYEDGTAQKQRTGKYYVEYIDNSEDERRGWWVNKKISAKRAQELLAMLKSLKDVKESDWK